MTSLSELEAIKTNQACDIITTYPKGDFTYVTSTFTMLTKRYSYDEVNKQLSRSETIFPVSGYFDRQNNASLGNLFKDMSLITQHNAFIQGVPKDHEKAGICAKGDTKDGCIARIKENFKYPDNAFILFDHDSSDRGYTVSNVDEFISILESIDPQLQTCAYTSKSSASSGIRLDSEILKSNKNFHLYMAIPGEQLKSYAKILFKQCILNDLGHVFISKNGRKYIRTIFDAAVHSPERLDFIAPAIVEYPLTIDEPIIQSRPGNSIDGDLLPEPTLVQEQKIKSIRQKLLDEAEDDALEIRFKYAKDQSKITGISVNKLFEFYNMGDQGEIDFEHPLTKDDGTQFSFADVIANPDKYKNLSMPDPFDPADGHGKAKLYINDDNTIVINSFAHGGTVYRLYRDGELYTGKPAISKQTALKNYPLDEVGNASRLINKYGDLIRYPNSNDDYNVKKWLIYNGKGWRNNSDGSVERLALETINSIVNEGHEIHSKTELKNHIKRFRKASHVMNILLVASWDEAIRIRGNDADEDPMLIGTLNGVVDLETGEIIQNSKEYFITKRVNASFDKEAKCPNWDRFLNRITGEDQDMIKYLNLLTSYFLTGETNEHKLFIVHGSGANGKTTWVKCIQNILGEYASQVPVESLSYTKSNAIDDNLARAKGSRLTVTSEIKKGTKLNEPLIKQLTGGDRIVARAMHKGSLEYEPTSKFIMVANDPPEITGSDPAMARRVLIIPFNQVIHSNEEDKRLPDKLKGEYDSIFTRAVLMCSEWQQNGLIEPKNIVDASTDYVESKDVFKQWKSDCLAADVSSEDFVSYDELITSHRAWCADHSVNVLSVNTFSARLQACTGVTKVTKGVGGKRARGYEGVKLAV